MKTYKTAKDAREDVTYWIRRLNLTDWDITLRVVPNLKVAGRCRCWLFSKQALIELRGRTHPKALRKDDAEATLVHELLHCTMQPLHRWSKEIKDDAVFDDDIECVVEGLAISLVKGRYKP